MNSTRFPLVALAAFWLGATHAAEFNARDQGVKGDRQTLDTTAIQKCFDACGKAGGGTVRLPAGTYQSKPLTLRTKTNLQLDEGAVLLATTNHADFMKVPGDWLKASAGGDFIPLLTGKELENITTTGKGVIDGITVLMALRAAGSGHARLRC